MATATPTRAPSTPTDAATKPVQIKSTINLDENCTLLVLAMRLSEQKTSKFGLDPSPAAIVREAVREFAKARNIKPAPRSAFLGEEDED